MCKETEMVKKKSSVYVDCTNTHTSVVFWSFFILYLYMPAAFHIIRVLVDEYLMFLSEIRADEMDSRERKTRLESAIVTPPTRMASVNNNVVAPSSTSSTSSPLSQQV